MCQIDFGSVTKLDLGHILEIEKNAFSRPWSRTSFINELIQENAFLFAARHINLNDFIEIIAYISYRLYETEMHIFKIAVKDNWRRHGVATRLLDTCLKDVSRSKVDSAFLEVRVSNTPAIAFYGKRGFVSIGRRPNYYSYLNTREDALLMMKNLKEEK